MRNAPSVEYPVGRSVFQKGLLAALALLTAALWLAWWWYSFEGWWPDGRPWSVWPWVGGALTWVGWLCWARWQVRHSLRGHLRWDAMAASAVPGQAARGAWHWHDQAAGPGPDGEPLQRVLLVWDGQGVALLRMWPLGAAPSWLWVERRADPLRWDDLRRALVASSGPLSGG